MNRPQCSLQASCFLPGSKRIIRQGHLYPPWYCSHISGECHPHGHLPLSQVSSNFSLVNDPINGGTMLLYTLCPSTLSAMLAGIRPGRDDLHEWCTNCAPCVRGLHVQRVAALAEDANGTRRRRQNSKEGLIINVFSASRRCCSDPFVEIYAKFGVIGWTKARD